jgi:sulfoxide reductase heme-binding subunit YedZ
MNPRDHVWWLLSRSSGVVAFVLCAASVLIGLAMAGKVLRSRKGLGRTLLAVHEHTAIAGLIATGVHGVTLLGDSWLRPSPADLAIPFLIDYRPVAVASGIVAGWLAAALGLTFYVRRRLGPKRWRAAHRATLLVYVLALAHALAAGTDATAPWFLAIAAGTGIPIAVLLAIRMTQAHTTAQASTTAQAHTTAQARTTASGSKFVGPSDEKRPSSVGATHAVASR